SSELRNPHTFPTRRSSDLYAQLSGWPIEGYERIEHPVQQSILNHVALWADMRPSQLDLAVDGCGVVVFGLPLDRMARAYARLGRSEEHTSELQSRSDLVCR